MSGLEIAVKVASLVSREDLDTLTRDAECRYRPGQLATSPAAVVVFRDGLAMRAQLAHRGCASSAVVEGVYVAATKDPTDMPLTCN